MMYCFTLLGLLVGAFVFQEFIPELGWAYSSTLLLVHAVFFSAAVSVPFPVMLIFAFITGFIWDCRYHIPISAMEGGVATPMEIPFGFTIFIFGLFGVFIQGVRPFFRQGRWELPVMMVGVCTLGSLLIEYLVICFNRGGIVMPVGFWYKILLTAFYSTLLAPFLLLLFSRLAGVTGFKIQMDGISRRYSYDGDSL